MQSEFKDQLTEAIFQAHYLKYAIKQNKSPLNIWGISAPTLAQYVTTEKDLTRQIDRKPNDAFLLDVLGTGTAKKEEKKEEEDLDAELDDFFDFVIIDKDDIIDEATKKNLQKKV